MILSMTGYGEAQADYDGQAFHVDLRSVNNRYLKTTVRLPEDYAFLEAEIEQALRRRLTRGSVTYRLHVRDLSASAAQELNLAAIETYIAQMRDVLTNEPQVTIDLAALAVLPGVCQPRELTEAQREACAKHVFNLTDEALDRLIEMRTTEGKALAEDLARHCAIVSERLVHVRERSPLVADAYRERLMTRIGELLARSGVELAADDLLKEVAIFAERSDISEELSRLESHLDQFTAAITVEEPMGRKLDFIAQEMLREVNTIGSKASDAQIARHVIDMKGAIDRIKEQVQNAE